MQACQTKRRSFRDLHYAETQAETGIILYEYKNSQ